MRTLTPQEIDAYAAALSTLGRFHREAPDEATLGAFGELLAEWPVPVTEDSSRGLEKLASSFEKGENSFQIRSDLNRLYGVSAKAKVAPYESVHRDHDGLLFDEQTLKVRDTYRKLALQVPRLHREPDDHIGVELDFVARCLLASLDSLDAGDTLKSEGYLQIASDFLAEHVNQWAPEMLQKAADQAETDFMQGICLLTIGTLQLLDEQS